MLEYRGADLVQRNRKRWAALILPLVAVGCSDLTERLNLPPVHPPDEVLAPVEEKVPDDRAAARARLKAEPRLPRPKPRILEATFNPDELIGLAPTRAIELLGEPSQRTEQFPAQIWRYESEKCAVSLMFFQELVSKTYRTLSYQVEVSNPKDLDAQRRCIGSLFASRRAQ